MSTIWKQFYWYIYVRKTWKQLIDMSMWELYFIHVQEQHLKTVLLHDMIMWATYENSFIDMSIEVSSIWNSSIDMSM